MDERDKVNLLASCIKEFVAFIDDIYEMKHHSFISRDAVFRLKLLTEEFQFKRIAEELLRLNRQIFEQQQTPLLIIRFQDAFSHVAEYVHNNENELFLFLGRIYTLEHYCLLMLTENEQQV